MAFWDQFKSKENPQKQHPRLVPNSSGIALFMVLSSISLLALLVVEFAYIAQVSQAVSFGALDQMQAFYTAKSGLKISLLRLRIFQKRDEIFKKVGLDPNIAKSFAGAMEQIWSTPFAFPIPSGLPGLSTMDKDKITKFNSSLSLAGSFRADITSESGKLSLNLLVEGPPPPPPDPEAKKKLLTTYLETLFRRKENQDPENDLIRNTRIDDLVEALAAWTVPGYPRITGSHQDRVSLKQAPFYSPSELYMLPGMEDEMARLLDSSFSTRTNPNVNINTASKETLFGLFSSLPPQSITEEEIDELIKFRSNPMQKFKDLDAFFNWVKSGFAVFKRDPTQWEDWKKELTAKNIQLVTDETFFKISVETTVNKSTKILEAWVELDSTPQKEGEMLAKKLGIQLKYPYSGLKMTFLKID